MFDFLDNLFKTQPEPVEAPVVEEPIEDTVEEEVEEEPAVEVPVIPPSPPPVVDTPDAAKVLSELWGVTIEQYNEALEEGKLDAKTIEFVQKLLDEKYAAEKKVAELSRFEELPAVKESKIAEQLADTWVSNIDEWSEELFDTIPDSVKLVKELGKKKTQELQKFIEEEAGVFLLERLKAGKKPLNPLLVKGNAIAAKIKELSGKVEAPPPQPQQQVIPQPPSPTVAQKPSPKKVASLSGASPVAETPNLEVSKAAESFMNNVSFFTMGPRGK